jgi:GT2 family glycosyltransferase
MVFDSAPIRVSVITPFLDAEQFFEEAIQSVLRQDYLSLELLLVDDGSTDESTKIALNYARRYPFVHYFEHPGHANRGTGASRNVGLNAASGEFAAFIDADDVWEPNKLGEQIAIMDAHPDIAMVCGTVRYCSSWAGGEDVLIPTGHVQNEVIYKPDALLKIYPLGETFSPCPSDLLVRRAAVIAVGGFEESFPNFYEDQAFLAKIYLAAPVYFSDRTWTNYRLHENSTCKLASHEDHRRMKPFFLSWLESYVADMPAPEPAILAAIKKAWFPFQHPWLHRLLAIAKASLRPDVLTRKIVRKFSARAQFSVGR